MLKCSTANCNKFFHPKCIKGNKLFKYYDANRHRKFRCSLHYCFDCGISGDTMTLYQCCRCYRAYHSQCVDKSKIIRLNKKMIVCQHHDIADRISEMERQLERDKLLRKKKSKENKKRRARERRNHMGKSKRALALADKRKKEQQRKQQLSEQRKALAESKRARKAKEKMERLFQKCLVDVFIGEEKVCSEMPALVKRKALPPPKKKKGSQPWAYFPFMP